MTLSTEEQAAASGLLRDLQDSPTLALDDRWVDAFRAVPRGLFVPDRIYVDGSPLDRRDDPGGWLTAVYGMNPVVTQLDDGVEESDDALPTSSSSDPWAVAQMLQDLDAQPGERVMELGTGTGWNAALLAHVAAEVVTVEVDQALAGRAAALLGRHAPRVRCIAGDGVLGAPDTAPYDRIVATCSVRRIPGAWLRQSRPGSVVVAPWSTPWTDWGTARLTVDEHGVASGRFAGYGSFMQLRGERGGLRIFRDVVRDDQTPDESATTLDPWAVTGADEHAAFAVGLRLPDVWHARQLAPDVDGVEVRTWLATTDATSWAAVDWDGDDPATRWTVWQFGPRRLWDEVAAAHAWWTAVGRPAPERFGCTVTPDRHWTWIDSPQQQVSFLLRTMRARPAVQEATGFT